MDTDRARDDVPEADRWNLDALYADDAAWEAAFDEFEAALDAFDADGALDDPGSFRAALERRDDLRERSSRLKIYANCRAWVDVEDDDAQEMVRRIHGTIPRRDAVVEEFETEMREAGRERVDDLLAAGSREAGDAGGLAAYEAYVDETFRRGRYRLGPAAEDALAAVDDALESPSRMLRTVRDRVYDPPTVETPDGDTVELTMRAYWEATAHPDRDYRRRAFEAMGAARRADRTVAAQAYADHLRSHAARADLRGYDDPLDAYLNGYFDEPAREGLLDGVREHRETFAGGYAALADRVDGDPRPWDRRAPVTDGDASVEIPFDDARDIVVEAVAPLGDAYQDRLAAFLDSDRVDVHPHAGKRAIGGAHFGSDGTPSYLFMNYLGGLPTVFLLAHEVAHAMHYLHARDGQPRAYRRISWEAGEIPSNVHEALVARHLLDGDRVPDAAVRAVARRRLSPLGYARDVAFARAATRAATGDGSLTADRLDDLYREHSNRLLAPIRFAEGDGWGWLGSFVDRAPMVPYLYVLGRVGALATAERLRAGDLDPETYRGFLAAGNSTPPARLLAEALDLELGGGVAAAAADAYADLDGA